MTSDEIENVIGEIHNTDLTQHNIKNLQLVLNYVLQNYSQFRDEAILIARLLQTYLKIHVCPVVIIYWDDEEKKQEITGASGILLNLDEKFLVTNRHVIEGYRTKRRKKDIGDPEPIFQIGHAVIDLETSIIDENETLDLATIKITDQILAEISEGSYKEFYTTDQWPNDRESDLKDAITLVGFPVVYRRTESSTESLFNYMAASLPVMDANDKTFYVEIDVGQAIQIIGEEDPSKLNDSLGGLSGGGVFTSSEDRLQLLGIIKEDGSGLFTGIQATYAYLINKDGTINTKFDLHK